MKAAEIATKAAELIGGDRERTHGDKTINHHKIAAVWNGILTAAGKAGNLPLDAHDVANLMEGLKIARRYLGSFNADDYIDGAGYASVAGEIAAKQHEVNQSWAERDRDGPTSLPDRPGPAFSPLFAIRSLWRKGQPRLALPNANPARVRSVHCRVTS